MITTPSKTRTLRFYDENAAEYAAEASGKIQRRQVLEFAKGLKPGACILDLGSGGGHDAHALLQLGFDVTMVDGSAGLAREAEARTGRAVRVLGFERLDYAAMFDGVWAAASLHHVHSTALPDVMERVVRGLKPSGLLFASLKEAGEDRYDRLGRYYSAMSSEQPHKLADQAGLIVETINRSEGFGYDGSQTMWLSMTARKKP